MIHLLSLATRGYHIRFYKMDSMKRHTTERFQIVRATMVEREMGKY